MKVKLTRSVMERTERKREAKRSAELPRRPLEVRAPGSGRSRPEVWGGSCGHIEFESHRRGLCGDIGSGHC